MTPSLKLLRYFCSAAQAGGESMVSEYERAFAETVLGDNRCGCLAFWRGRVALWTVLKAAGIGAGDEVVLSAYTCEMVPAAVRFTGATCAYCDLAPGRFSPGVEQVRAATTPRTRAVICQYTYGIPQDIAPLRSLCEEVGALLIEDRCQSVTQGFAGDAAIFSTQWNKPYSTGLGGMAAFRSADMYARAAARRDTFPRADARQRGRSLATQLLVHQFVARGRCRELAAVAYRAAQMLRMVRGTTAPDEYGDEMPDDYLAGAVDVQAEVGLHELSLWPSNVDRRRRLTRAYLEELGRDWLGDEPDDTALWAVPALVEEKEAVLRSAQHRGLPVRTWSDSLPVHVAPATCARYGYRPGQCPVAESVFLREVHLPTTPWVPEAQARRAARWLKSLGPGAVAGGCPGQGA